MARSSSVTCAAPGETPAGLVSRAATKVATKSIRMRKARAITDLWRGPLASHVAPSRQPSLLVCLVRAQGFSRMPSHRPRGRHHGGRERDHEHATSDQDERRWIRRLDAE